MKLGVAFIDQNLSEHGVVDGQIKIMFQVNDSQVIHRTMDFMDSDLES